MSKNILVTGAGRGIGFELCKQLADAGHKVFALSRNLQKISKLHHTNITAVSFDLSSDKSFDTLQGILKDLKKIDILINNAGWLVHKPFEQLSQADFQQSYEVNVFGPIRLIQLVLPYMPKDGHVVNISSMGGIQGSVKFGGLAAYSSAKAALINLTELLAEEYKESGPSFNVLALGAVQTEMLAQAFPGYQAPISAPEMASYIAQFAVSGNVFYNGKILQVSSSTP
ncbi:MAG: SDR family oxidoreductase [Bacteroidetes bacterium]|nr:SDR family oxidoreductase [Bacteroidota bacterium]